MTNPISFSLVYENPILAQVLGGDAAPASATQAPGTPGAPAGQQPSGGMGQMLPFIIIMTVGMFLIMSMSGRKEKKKRAQLLASIGKKDKVRTAGGIIGTIIEFKGTDEVLIETDRASNTRLLLARTSITQVIESANKPVTDKVAQIETNAESVPS